jgi:hypothetical protein
MSVEERLNGEGIAIRIALNSRDLSEVTNSFKMLARKRSSEPHRIIFKYIYTNPNPIKLLNS